MAKVWENRNGKCYCYGRLMSNPGCHGANCRTCCYNLGKVSESGYSLPNLTLAEYNTIPKEEQAFIEKPLEDHRKVINSLSVNRINTFLDPNGENRKITITGDVGSVFTLTIKDSYDCSILDEELDNISIPQRGMYILNQEFPKLKHKVTSESYDIVITPSADVKLSESITNSVHRPSLAPPDLRLYQYANPTMTFTNTTTQTSPALTVSGSNITKTARANTFSDNIPGYTSSTYTLAITENPSTAGFFYVKDNPKFNDKITNNSTVKKILKRSDELGSYINEVSLDPSTTRTVTDKEGNTTISSDLTAGMSVYGSATYTKTVAASIDTVDCNDSTDKFRLHENHDLFVGMIVTGRSNDKYIETTLIALNEDCDNSVTLESKYVIREGTVLTFKHEEWNTVGEVIENINSKGQAKISLGGVTQLPNNTELTFDDDETLVHGAMTWSGNGTNTVTLTTTLDVVKFGIKDATYTLDLDDFIVRKPNAYDQYVEIKKNTSIIINMIRYDRDENAATEKVAAIKSGPYNGSASLVEDSDNTLSYLPNTGFTGEDFFRFTMSDGTTLSDEKTIFITVN